MTARPSMPYAVSAVTGDNFNAFAQTVQDAGQLRTLTGVGGMSVTLLGIAAPNDSLGGQFYWDGASVAADDNLNTIVPTGVYPGGWLRDGPLIDFGTLALVDLSNVDDSVFQAKGAASGLALADLTNVPNADFYDKAVESGVIVIINPQ